MRQISLITEEAVKRIRSLAWNTDGTLLACEITDASVRVWDPLYMCGAHEMVDGLVCFVTVPSLWIRGNRTFMVSRAKSKGRDTGPRKYAYNTEAAREREMHLYDDLLTQYYSQVNFTKN